MDKLLGVNRQHVVTEDLAEIGGEVLQRVCFEQVERTPVDLHDVDVRGTLTDARHVIGEEGAQVADALRAPLIEQPFQAAVVFDP